MKTSVMIASLPLITNPETFFNTDKILSVDVVCIDAIPNLTRLKLEISKTAMRFNGKLYLPILLKGSPENLILKAKNGVPAPYGLEGVVFFDGGLNDLLAKNKVYDLSRHYRMKNVEFMFEHEWLYTTFIQPYEEKKIERPRSLKYRLDHTVEMQAGIL